MASSRSSSAPPSASPRRRPPSIPAVAATDRRASPVDAFILAKLDENGLPHSAPADRSTLVRRLYLDLIGIPPSPAEVDAFVADKSPHAERALVERLLSSPHYGERMAQNWLDLARYADSNGFQQDGDTWQWIWRDWVVKALNEDLPFDQFTIEQLAGDLLPGASPEQLIATGFHRNTMINEEGGVDPLEFRRKNLLQEGRPQATGTPRYWQ
mgnify:CR=1 FL=1